MNTPWGFPDFDAHEALHFVTDAKSGLRAIIALHSTHLGPAAGGTRMWHYADDADALTDALRLSRGMSYKNAMAGLPLGGGKAVVLADANRTKTPEMIAAFGRAVDRLGGNYVTAEDVGMSVADMIAIREQTTLRRRPAGRRAAKSAAIRARTPRSACSSASRPRSAARSARTASPGSTSRSRARAASPAESRASPRPKARACRSPTSTPAARTALAAETDGTVVADRHDPRRSKPTSSARARSARSSPRRAIAALNAPIVAGGANNQLATPRGRRADRRARHPLRPRLCHQRRRDHQRLDRISRRRRRQPGAPADRGDPRPARAIWAEAAATGTNPAAVADAMAQKLIGRG